MNDDYDYIMNAIEEREEAENNGLYGGKLMPNLSVEDEMALYSAASTLTNLMKTTNSSISDLLTMAGFSYN